MEGTGDLPVFRIPFDHVRIWLYKLLCPPGTTFCIAGHVVVLLFWILSITGITCSRAFNICHNMMGY